TFDVNGAINGWRKRDRQADSCRWLLLVPRSFETPKHEHLLERNAKDPGGSDQDRQLAQYHP
ncbi:MAG: hypothetical protein JWN51_323, partial [Phycisphaerales bacterium]|nr:hypothetical protein [Phycisphaerales bacterium]